MAKLTHSHRLMKNQVNHHADSKGVQFGNDEHSKVIETYDWADLAVSEVVEHTHQHIREERVEQGGVTIWLYAPPNAREAEMEIGRPVGAAKR
jgi:hypothetical protein